MLGVRFALEEAAVSLDCQSAAGTRESLLVRHQADLNSCHLVLVTTLVCPMSL